MSCSGPGWAQGQASGRHRVTCHRPSHRTRTCLCGRTTGTLLGRSGRPGQACVPGELRPDTHAWTRSFLGCCPHVGLLETGLRTCAEHKSPGVMASAHSPPHPTLWTPHPGDGVWPLSHSPQGGESPQVSTLGTRAPTPALAPSGPASVPAGPQSGGGGSGGLPSPLEKSWVLTPSPSALQTRANTS